MIKQIKDWHKKKRHEDILNNYASPYWKHWIYISLFILVLIVIIPSIVIFIAKQIHPDLTPKDYFLIWFINMMIYVLIGFIGGLCELGNEPRMGR